LEAKQGQQPGCAVMVDDTIFASSSVIGGYVDLVLEATGAGKITRKKPDTGFWPKFTSYCDNGNDNSRQSTT
jgi:hypothetical protein